MCSCSYPALTNKIFEGLSCRTIGENAAVLAVDYGMDCHSSTYRGLQLVLGLLVIIWPVGVPASLFFELYNKRDLILAKDPKTLERYAFALDDYKLEYWYWEVVELARKLILTGIIALIGRGTVAQAVMATFVAFFFFALAVKAQPFHSEHLNQLKMFCEAQLFAVLLIIVVLQTDQKGLSTQSIRADEYGTAQVVLVLAVVPAVVILISIEIKAQWALVRERKSKPQQTTKFDNAVHTDSFEDEADSPLESTR